MNSVITLVIFTTVILITVVISLVIVYTRFLRKKAQLLLRQRADKARFEAELAKTQIEIKEQTLTYVGQELHDDLGQKLSVAKMMNNSLMTRCDPACKEEIEDINNLIGECIQDIRNLSKTFITGQIKFLGLYQSINNEVKRIERLEIPKISFFSETKDLDVGKEHSLILFRMIQEAITNVLKHSRAKNLEIRIEENVKGLVFQVSDDGIGLPPHYQEGSGMMNMKHRANLINAKFLAKSRQPQGTIIEIVYNKTEIPWKK